MQFASKLNDKNLNEKLMRSFAALQGDPEPAVRTNTVICLGKIADLLSPAARKKVLIPAFTRALRDPFPHARAAGLRALNASHSKAQAEPDTLAAKVLPVICPLLVDPAPEVRGVAFQTLRSIVGSIESMVEVPVPVPSTASSTANAGRAAPPAGSGLGASALDDSADFDFGDEDDGDAALSRHLMGWGTDGPSSAAAGASSQPAPLPMNMMSQSAAMDDISAAFGATTLGGGTSVTTTGLSLKLPSSSTKKGKLGLTAAPAENDWDQGGWGDDDDEDLLIDLGAPASKVAGNAVGLGTNATGGRSLLAPPPKKKPGAAGGSGKLATLSADTSDFFAQALGGDSSGKPASTSAGSVEDRRREAERAKEEARKRRAQRQAAKKGSRGNASGGWDDEW